MKRVKSARLAFALLAAVALSVTIAAQQAGPNVNVLPSFPMGRPSPPFPPDPITLAAGELQDASLKGDIYLQRQAEPVVAASTLNPDHLLAAYGDFRTVDIGVDAGVPGAGSEGWIGYSRSYDRGKHWYGALVPGFPGGRTPVDLSSPLYGLQAGSDAVMATTPGGHFYLGGLFFDRDKRSVMAAMHLRDVPNLDGGDSIQPGKIVIVDRGSNAGSDAGSFEDKPSIVGDIARGTNDPSVCGPVYMAYTIFTGGTSGVFTSKVGFSRSKQGKCGETWDNDQYVNKNFKQNQGTAMAIDPATGKIYIVWRHFYVPGGDGFPDALVMAASTDYGASFSAPVAITGTDFAPYDQISIGTGGCTTGQTCPVTFRSQAFPTIAIDGGGSLYVGIQEKAFNSDGYYEPRITVRTLKAGAKKWTAKSYVDGNPVWGGQQMMPSFTFGGGILGAIWYDFRAQARASTNIARGWYISGMDRRMETFGAQAGSFDAAGNPIFTAAAPVTKYLKDVHTGQTPPLVPDSQVSAVNWSGLPMYAKGTTAFNGDYITLVSGSPFAGSFRWATNPTDYAARSFLSVWTDTRDVAFPGGDLFNISGWQSYAPPGAGGASCINPGSRNQNVYFSEIKPGVIAGSPATSRQLVDGAGKPFERAFPFYVENPNRAEKFFKLTFQADSPAVKGSFVQGIGAQHPVTAVPSIDVDILPFSTVSKTIYALCSSCTSTNAFAPFSILVTEIKSIGGAVVPNGLNTLLRFNSDPTAPFVTNPLLSSQEIHAVTLSNPQYSDPQYSDPQYSDPQYSDPQYSDPQYSDPQYSDPQYSDPQYSDPQYSDAVVGDFVWTATNVGNNSSAYTTNLNISPSLLNSNYKYKLIIARSYNTPGFNGCSSQPIPHDQIISIIPLATKFSNPQYSDPQYSDPQYSDPQYSDASFTAMPPSDTSSGGTAGLMTLSTTATSSTDGSGTAPIQPDRVFIVLRVYAPIGTPSLSPEQQTTILANVSATVTPQAADSIANNGVTTVTARPTPASNKTFSTTTLSASAASSAYGQPVTLTAHVTQQATATAVTGGTVGFREVNAAGATVRLLAVAAPVDANGNATVSVSDFAVASHWVNAIFSGTAAVNGSISNAVSEMVTTATTSTTVTSSLNPSTYATPVTFTAAVTSQTIVPQGTVVFSEGETVLQTSAVDADGKATYPTADLAVGSHTITATFSGANFATSAGSVVQTVNPAIPDVTLAVDPNPATTAQAVTLTATVYPPSAAGGVPAGAVSFYVVSGETRTLLGTVDLAPVSGQRYGVGSLTVGPLQPGTYQLQATYVPQNSNFAEESSSVVTLTVTANN